MGSRPDFLELHGDGSRSARGSPSPRIEHFDGEIPPALSPLDAFAAQGRMLARQLDESMRRDRRMSRLPPQSVARSLSQPRPGYFRSPTSDHSQRSHVTRSPDLIARRAIEDPKFRPQSQHPRISGLSILHGDGSFDDPSHTPVPRIEDYEKDASSQYFEGPRVETPEEDAALHRDGSDSASNLPTPHSNSQDSSSISRGSSSDSNQPQISTTLAPPVSPMPHSLYNPKYMQPESSDDDYTSSNAGSTFSKSRQLSSGSGISMPHSPMSPFVRSHPRSPSVSSEASNYLPRPSFNFSRPLSRSSTSLSAPSPVIPSEAPTSNQSTILSTVMLASDGSVRTGIQRDNKPAPIVLEGEPMTPLDEEMPSSAVSSYVYTKYSLPRGRMVSRNSLVFAGLQTPHFEWKEPLFESPPNRNARDRTPSPEAAPKEAPMEAPVQQPRTEDQNLKILGGEPIPTLVDPLDTVPETPVTRQSHEIPRGLKSSQEPLHTLHRSMSEHLDDSKSSSADSASTIRPVTAKTTATTASAVNNLSVEEHVEKGIECHEQGALQESTYHLRIAAKQNHPTGMLLYALACRHGWGMRPNQREGVQWLRKAVDSAGLEMADDDDDDKSVGGKDVAARKARRAQFALGIYELGVSHLNGWGIEQDKALALRCFEIAARWGDADALAEAGFCYAQGVGCKKDLMKAARYYRKAEAKGMSMVGNSWIYKDKYMADDDDSRQSRHSRSRQSGMSEKNPRSKSRTRSIFGRKKSTV
ncbi:hypothetical protein BGW36DRAFT_291743 [Talaromyces proteolyticus]|uniref:Cell cycle inhibitor Nif1 n=1 Tax=Talaromyces proteolyticus TaxID=1131652 RepID=A0AAD4Q0D6_9EURO|nr:uncharacterized protein BGW36DRAFT_291743 [Talaromyces proteolyticus]KAH8700684.1 hypothetical protein BGW36DRAFT_291743 [Talaromyces proteolyticus]